MINLMGRDARFCVCTKRIICILGVLTLFITSSAYAQKLLIISGNNQIMGPGGSTSLVIKTVDEKNNPISGMKVEFSLHSIPFGADDAMISESEVLSDKSGIASTTLSVGNKIGTYRVSASSRTQSVLFKVQVAEKKDIPQISRQMTIPWPEEVISPLPPLEEKKIVEIEKETEEEKILPPKTTKQIEEKSKDKKKTKKSKKVEVEVEDKKENIPTPQIEEKKSSFRIFTVAGYPTRIKIKVKNNTLIANGEDNTLVCAEVYDKHENRVQDGTYISFAANIGKIVATDKDPQKEGVQQETKNGMACVSYLSDVITGVGRITVKSGEAETEEYITLKAGSPHKLKVSPEKLKISAGETYIFQALIFDSFNNQVEITPIFSVVGQVGEIDNNGKFIAKITGEGEVVATVANLQAKAMVQITPGAPDKISILFAPKKVQVKDSAKITGRILDRLNNPVPDIPVKYEVILGSVNLASFSDTTDVAGRFNISFATQDKVEENQIKISSSGVSPTTVKILTVASYPAKIILSSDTFSAVADGKSTANIFAEVYDKYGNTASDGTVVSFFVTGGNLSGEDIDTSSPGLQQIIKEGKSNVKFVAGTAARPAQIECRVDEVKEQLTISLLPDKPSRATIDVSSSRIVANSMESAQVVVFVLDSFGNRVQDGQMITATTTEGEIVADDISPAADGIQLVTKDGNVKFKVKSSTRAGVAVIQIAVDNISFTKPINFVAGPLFRIKVIPEEVKIVAGQSFQFSAKGVDAFDNTIEISPTYRSKIGRVNESSGLFTATKSGVGAVSSQVDNVIGTSVVTVLPAEPVEIKITAHESEVIVGEVIPIIATVYDNFGNPVPNIEVIFHCKTPGAKLSTEKGITDEDGTLSTMLTLPTTITDVIIDATSPQIKRPKKEEKKEKRGTNHQSPIQFAFAGNYDVPVFAQSTSPLRIKAQPAEPADIEVISSTEIVADGKTTGEVVIKVMDKYRNLVVDGTVVNFSTNRGKIISNASPQTREGIVSVLLLSDIRAGPARVLIRAGPVEREVMVLFVPEVNKIVVSATPLSSVADGKGIIKVKLSCYDKGDSVVSENAIITIKTKNSRVLSPVDISDKIDGVQFKITSEINEITLQAPVIAGKETVDFYSQKASTSLDLLFTPGELSKIGIHPSYLTLPAGKKYKLQIEGEDKLGNLIPDVSYAYKIIGDGEISKEGDFSSLKVGSGKVIIYKGDIFGFADFEIIADKPQFLNLSSSHQVVLAGEKVEIYLEAKDKHYNPAANYKFNVKELTTGSKLYSNEVITNAEGKAIFEFTTSTVAGVNAVLVSHEDVNNTINIIGKPHKPEFIFLSVSPTVYTPNSILVISAKVLDVHQNIVEGGTQVAFSTTGGTFKGGVPVTVVDTVGGTARADLFVGAPPSEITLTAQVNGATAQITVKPAISISISPMEPLISTTVPTVEEIVQVESKIIDRLIFKEADIRVVLQALSEKGNLNIIADEKITGVLTLSLINIPVLEALELILQSKGYSYRKIGLSIIVYSGEERKPQLLTEVIKIKSADASEIKDLAKELIRDGTVLVDKRTNSLIVSSDLMSLDEVRKLVLAIDYPMEGVEGGGSIITSIFRLNYADALHVSAILQNMGFGKTAGTSIQIYNQPAFGTSSAAGNLIVARETAQNITRMRKAIEDIDKPPPQVRVEVRIEEINHDAARDLGVKWSDVISATFQERALPGGNPLGGLQTFTRSAITVSSLLSTLQSQGKSKTLASPSITTVDGREARIFLGKKIPYFPKVVYGQGQTIQVGTQTTTGTSQQVSTVVEPQFKDAGITLNITPRVDSEGYVSTVIRIDVSSLVGIIQDVPMTEQRSADTIIRIKDGETIVIGGLISNEEIERLSKFPILSDAPILGSLFKSRRKENKQTELVIFLTPYIIK